MAALIVQSCANQQCYVCKTCTAPELVPLLCCPQSLARLPCEAFGSPTPAHGDHSSRLSSWANAHQAAARRALQSRKLSNVCDVPTTLGSALVAEPLGRSTPHPLSCLSSRLPSRSATLPSATPLRPDPARSQVTTLVAPHQCQQLLHDPSRYLLATLLVLHVCRKESVACVALELEYEAVGRWSDRRREGDSQGFQRVFVGGWDE